MKTVVHPEEQGTGRVNAGVWAFVGNRMFHSKDDQATPSTRRRVWGHVGGAMGGDSAVPRALELFACDQAYFCDN